MAFSHAVKRRLKRLAAVLLITHLGENFTGVALVIHPHRDHGILQLVSELLLEDTQAIIALESHQNDFPSGFDHLRWN